MSRLLLNKLGGRVSRYLGGSDGTRIHCKKTISLHGNNWLSYSHGNYFVNYFWIAVFLLFILFLGGIVNPSLRIPSIARFSSLVYSFALGKINTAISSCVHTFLYSFYYNSRGFLHYRLRKPGDSPFKHR